MSGVSGPFAIPSVVSGAEKAVKDLEQLATADPEALIDSIEALLPDGTSQDAGVTTGSSAGLVTGLTGLADPVLSKGNGSLTQGGGCKPAVNCGTLYSSSAFTHLIAPKRCLYSFDCAQAVPFPLWFPKSSVFSPCDYPQASTVPISYKLNTAQTGFTTQQWVHAPRVKARVWERQPAPFPC